MKVVIYYDGRIAGGDVAAREFASTVRADGGTARLRDASNWHDGDVEPCDRVVLVHEAPEVAAAYEGKAELLSDASPAADESEPAPRRRKQ